MAKQKVFSQGIKKNTFYSTSSLNGAVAFYLSAPDIPDEFILSFYLQVEVTTFENRAITITPEPIGDSIFLYLIPTEYQFIEENIHGLLNADFEATIEVWAIYPQVSLEQIKEQIEQLREDLIAEINENETAIGINQLLNSGIIGTQIGQLQGLTLLATTLAPVTAGTSLTSAAAFELTATSATALLAGGIL